MRVVLCYILLFVNLNFPSLSNQIRCKIQVVVSVFQLWFLVCVYPSSMLISQPSSITQVMRIIIWVVGQCYGCNCLVRYIWLSTDSSFIQHVSVVQQLMARSHVSCVLALVVDQSFGCMSFVRYLVSSLQPRHSFVITLGWPMSFAQTLKSSPFIFLHIRFLNHVLYPRALMLMPDKEKNRKNIKSMILTCLGCNIDLSTYFFNPNLHLLKTPLPQITFMSPKTLLHSLLDPSRPQPPLVFINPRFPW